jgi:hypothetical protein
VADGVTPAAPYRHKFTLAYFLLAAVVGMAVAAFVVLFFTNSTTRTPTGASAGAVPEAWNGFQPQGFLDEQVHQIGSYVAATYRLPDHRQLVAIKSSIPPTFQNSLVITDYAVSVSAGGKSNYEVFPAANGVSYELCGLGPDCSIASGKASVARGRLLRREALELALYTFHYEPTVQTVVTYMPPRRGEKASFVYLFPRTQLAAHLTRPLTATLPEVTPPRPDAIPATEAATIDGLTQPDLYRFSFTRGQDGGVWLVFDPPNLG